MKKKIYLIGSGGHASSCIDVIESTNNFEIAGIVDLKSKIGEKVLDYKVLACDDDLLNLRNNYEYALVTIGQFEKSKLRTELFKFVKSAGYKLPVVISPSAYVSKYCEIGDGTIIMHQAMVNSNVKIGENNIINSRALVEHDVKIGNHNHLSTNSILNGEVVIKNNCFIGSNSILTNNIRLQNDIVIGAHSFVNRSLKEKGTYFGCPVNKYNG